MSTLATSSSDQLLGRAKRVLAAGALGRFSIPDEVSVVFESGSGSRLRSVDGDEFIDYLLGSGPVLLGHAHPAVIEAVQAQLGRGTTFFFLNEPAIQLAERLTEAVPCADQLRYTSTGTEATHLALRGARAFTGRSKILKFEGAWHGMHDYALWGTVPTEASDYPHSEADSAGIPEVIGDEVLVAPFNDLETTREIIETHAHELGAVIMEPLQRVLKPEPGFLEGIRELTRRLGIVLIFDEIVTGFRIAWGGSQERYGVVPDMATYGKAMAGAFPLAAIMGRADVMDVYARQSRSMRDVAWASGTFSGNPIGASAGLAALDVLGAEGVYDGLRATGSRLRRGIEDLGRKHGVPTQALGEDAVFGVRFMENSQPKTWMDLQDHDADFGHRWSLECIRGGLLLNPNEKWYVSIAHDDADLDETLEIVDGAFRRALG